VVGIGRRPLAAEHFPDGFFAETTFDQPPWERGRQANVFDDATSRQKVNKDKKS